MVKTKYLRRVILVYVIYGVVFVAALLLSIYVFRFIVVEGTSMYPTLKEDDAIFCTQMFNKNNLKSGDIIVFEYEGRNLVKRIAKTEDGIAYADGGTELMSGVKDDELFVLGDNPESSRDSRVFGPIKIDSVKYLYKNIRFSKYILYSIIGLYILSFVVVSDCVERKYLANRETT